MVEIKLSSFTVRSPRRFGDCWSATQLWAELGLHTFWRDALAADAGDVGKVLELLVVNRLLAPRSELFVHEKWFPQSAMDVLLDTDVRVADMDRLYRWLGRLLVHKPALEQHLAAKLLAQLNWSLPQQPPPRVYARNLPPPGPEVTEPSQAA